MRESGASDVQERSSGGSEDTATAAPDRVAETPDGGRQWRLAGSRVGRSLAHFLENYGVALLLIPLVLLFASQNSQYLSLNNLENIARQISIFGIIGVGMTIVILMAQIDLSVGAIVAFSGVVAAFVVNAGADVLVAIAAGMGAGAGIGVINGVVTVAFAIPSLLVTLGMLSLVRGFAFVLTDGRSVAVPSQSFSELAAGEWLGLPYPVWIMFAVGALGWLVMTQTDFGRSVYAVGGNPEAARRAGLHVRRTIIVGFIILGALSGLAGVILASRLASGQPVVGQGYELYVIAATVLGGTSLFGGRGTILGTLLGVLVIGSLQNGMDLLAIQPFWQQVAIGALVILALIVDSVRARRLASLRRILLGDRVR
jgi:ribose/xylose/arabinose/galactoside ABC-type transport system permease subunit